MSWWCSSSKQTWVWTPRPYLGALIIVWSLLGVATWWRARGRHNTDADPAVLAAQEAAGDAAVRGSSKGRTWALLLGTLGLWACLDWPLASLGAGYLASAQMARQVLMVMVVAPLLLFACPAPLAVRIVGWGKRLSVLRMTARPIFAVPFAAVALVAINAPAVVVPLVKTPFGAFGLDFVWVAAGFVLWMPVQCPHPGVRRLTGGAALCYLIGQSIVPVLPGFFMTWADQPIYSTYELAPRVFPGFDAVADQQTAAAILQVGGMLLLWFQISYRFLKWAYEQIEQDNANRKAMPEAGTASP